MNLIINIMGNIRCNYKKQKNLKYKIKKKSQKKVLIIKNILSKLITSNNFKLFKTLLTELDQCILKRFTLNYKISKAQK